MSQLKRCVEHLVLVSVNASCVLVKISCTHNIVYIVQNETLMQTELYDRGPLSVLMNALELQFYRRGVYDPLFPCNTSYLDHGQYVMLPLFTASHFVLVCFKAVLLVGYGTADSLFDHKPYWVSA